MSFAGKVVAVTGAVGGIGQDITHVQDTLPNLGIVSKDQLHSPDTTYWPELDGGRGGAPSDEFAYFATCALNGRRAWGGRRMQPLSGNVVRIGGN